MQRRAKGAKERLKNLGGGKWELGQRGQWEMMKDNAVNVFLMDKFPSDRYAADKQCTKWNVSRSWYTKVS